MPYQSRFDRQQKCEALHIGGVVGAVMGLLLAPQSGEETREMLARNSEELKNKAEKTVKEIQGKAEDIVSDMQKKGDDIMEKIQTMINSKKEAKEEPKAEV